MENEEDKKREREEIGWAVHNVREITSLIQNPNKNEKKNLIDIQKMFQFKIHKDTKKRYDDDDDSEGEREGEWEYDLKQKKNEEKEEEKRQICVWMEEGKLLLMMKTKGWVRREMRFREIIMQKSY